MDLKGTEYLYFDDKKGKLGLSKHTLDASGALPNTLNQIYKAGKAEGLGWVFYNDESPFEDNANSSRGHTKGVLAFDLETNSGFWLINSVPKFPPQDTYTFPNSGTGNAQTLLCITLHDADVARQIAEQMRYAHQPNVYLASPIPKGMAMEDARARLIKNDVGMGATPFHASVQFSSRGGKKFMCLAKNKPWGLDFYNDLVGPALHDDLDVETWEHGATPSNMQSDKVHRVVDMKGIDLNKLGYNIRWPEPDDHAKLAISDRKEDTRYVCVGDINFTLSQRHRGGGTVAFQCDALWQAISDILVGVWLPPKTHG